MSESKSIAQEEPQQEPMGLLMTVFMRLLKKNLRKSHQGDLKKSS